MVDVDLSGPAVCTIWDDVDGIFHPNAGRDARSDRAHSHAPLTLVRKLVLGLDGGNTKTVAIVAGLDGTVLGTGRAGCGDIYGSTAEAALVEIDAAIGGALAEAGATRADIVAAGCSLAGADWPEDYDFLDAEMRRRLPKVLDVVIVNDGLGGLRAGTSDGEGVAVVCGTGSAIGARRGDEVWHASFWGEDGGAGTLGRAALRALIRSDLGLDPPVAFRRDALDVIGVPTVEALLHRATRREAPRTLLARLAPMLLDAADAGDPVAVGIVIDSGRVLGEYARVAADRVGLRDRTYPLVLAGGVFLHPSPLLRREIAAALPEASLVESEFEPVVGALLLGFDRLDGQLDVDALRLSLPHAERFRTLVGRERMAISADG